MSSKSTNTTGASLTPTTILDRVKAFLKLGDDGKIASFYQKLEKQFRRDIKNVEAAIQIAISNFEQVTDKYVDDLADANEAVDNAWLAITAENVATNEDQTEFMVYYMGNIERAERAAKAIQQTYDEAKAVHDKLIEKENARIAVANARIAYILGQ